MDYNMKRTLWYAKKNELLHRIRLSANYNYYVCENTMMGMQNRATFEAGCLICDGPLDLLLSLAEDGTYVNLCSLACNLVDMEYSANHSDVESFTKALEALKKK